MVLTDCRDQLDSYGIDTALKYLDGKLTENAIKRLLGENTMFNEVSRLLLFALQQQSIGKQSQTDSHKSGMAMSNQMPTVASVAARQVISVYRITCIHLWAACSIQQLW